MTELSEMAMNWSELNTLEVNQDHPNGLGWVWAKVFVPECFQSLSIKDNQVMIYIMLEILTMLTDRTEVPKLVGLTPTENQKRTGRAMAMSFINDYSGFTISLDFNFLDQNCNCICPTP